MRKTFAIVTVIATLFALALTGCKVNKSAPTNCARADVRKACVEGNTQMGQGGVIRDYSEFEMPLGEIDFNKREAYPNARRFRDSGRNRLVHFFATWLPAGHEMSIGYGDYNALEWTNKKQPPFDKTMLLHQGDVAELYVRWPNRHAPAEDSAMLCAILLRIPAGEGQAARWVLVRSQPRPTAPALRNLYLNSVMFSTRGECLATLLIP